MTALIYKDSFSNNVGQKIKRTTIKKNYFISTIGSGLAIVLVATIVMGDFTNCGQCLLLIIGAWILGTLVCGLLNLTYFLRPLKDWKKYSTLLFMTAPSLGMLIYFNDKFNGDKIIDFNGDTMVYYSCFGANFLFGLWTWIKTEIADKN
jgi:hypothetical protein